MKTHLKLFLALAVALSGVACKKSAESERKDLDKAEAKVADNDQKAREARVDAINEYNDYLAAVAREKIDYRGRIQGELDDLDKQLLDKKLDATKADELRARRDVLLLDKDFVEKATDKDWDQVKTRLDKDLSSVQRRGRI